MLRNVTGPDRSPYSPRVGGYVIAILIALVVFALGLVPLDGLRGDGWDFDWGVVLAVLALGAIPAAVIGSLGAVIVHFLTRGVAAQSLHVLAATVAGVVAGGLVYQDVLSALLLGVGTGVGRLAVSHERFLGPTAEPGLSGR